MRTSLLFIFIILPNLIWAQAKVDTIEVFSAAMNKTLKAAVTKPAGYETSSEKYPVLYLLHGGSGAFDDWHKKVTEPGLVNRMAEEYNLIIVTPGVGPSSYYYDSPLMDSVQYETYIIKELIPEIDKNYKTLAKRESRAISGLSMGGHGAMMLSAKHPELFIAAGSMSGVMNIDTRLWNVPDGFKETRTSQQKAMLGDDLVYDEPFSTFTAVGLVDKMKTNGIALTFDVGVDDFLIATNRQIHELLLKNETDHEYTERPGAHSWPYWTNSLPYHLLFFSKHLKWE